VSRARALAFASFTALLASCAGDAPPARLRPLTLDTHIDIPLDYATAAADPLTAKLQVNLQKMAAGGLDAGFFIVFVGQTERSAEGYARAQANALTKFAAIHRMAEELYPDRIEIAYSADDVARIATTGKLVAAIGIENGFSLGSNLELLDRYFDLGARYLGLVHDGDNDLARSARPNVALGDAAESPAGVSALGADAIARANRLGLMIDVSHGSKQTALDAMRLSAAPVIASHSGIAGVNAHPRNLDDETLRALQADGGVVQVVAFDSYLKDRTGGRAPPATVADLVDHIDYAVRLIGVEHVGIASDFDGGGGVLGWADAAETANVTAELQARGYSDKDIEKIWSGNLLRVWREAERTAARLAAAP
jgi:membrane dipeptidase